jgi:hypothetical protein
MMRRRFEPSTEGSRRRDAAIEQVRRLFERYRAYPHPAVKRPESGKPQESQRTAERRTDGAL